MSIDIPSLEALQIFTVQDHPNRNVSDQKDGLSIFSTRWISFVSNCVQGVLDRTKSCSGKKLLRRWFLRPLQDIDLIKERQKVIGCLTHPSNISGAKELHKVFNKIPNVKTIFTALKKAPSISHFTVLLGFFKSLLVISDLVNILPRDSPMGLRVINAFLEVCS